MIFPSITNNIKSEIEKFAVQSEKIKAEMIYFSKNKTSYILAHFVDQVQLGWIYDGEIQFYKHNQFHEKYLLEARIFHEDGELYLWKNGDEFQGRKRIDYKEPGDSQCCDMKYAIWGRKKEADENNWIILEEKERGLKVFVPSTRKIENSSKIFYKVRNYYSYDEDGMIQFKDARLCSLLDEQGNPL
ncbi:MAG TPA: TIGR03984 family CRISPR-associated protein [Bacillus bacterium]|nr:TIGR03984 family CRISPR-associated protein [Bacillus sp. (in: firmicutes)]